MDRLLFGNYMVPSAELRPYVQITNMPQLSKASHAAKHLKCRRWGPQGRHLQLDLGTAGKSDITERSPCRPRCCATQLKVMTCLWVPSGERAPPHCQQVSANTDLLSA